MKNKNILIIYHLEDNDGVCSCAIMEHYIRTHFKDANVERLPGTYKILSDLYEKGKDFLDEYFAPYDTCIMLDISFNDYKAMKYLSNKFGNRFIWCDHHLPIIKASFKHGFDNINGVRDTTRSAILNTYKYLYDPLDEKYFNGTVPELFKYLSAFDSWSFDTYKLDFDVCRYINTAVTMNSCLNVDWWLNNNFMENIIMDVDMQEYINNLHDEGKQRCDELDKRNAEMIAYAGDTTWTVGDDNRPACMLVLYGGSNSLMFKSVKDTCKNGIVLKKTNDSHWTLHLYNTVDDSSFHCGDYLNKRYKGGGHEGAAGATISQSTFIKLLKAKHV